MLHESGTDGVGIRMNRPRALSAAVLAVALGAATTVWMIPGQLDRDARRVAAAPDQAGATYFLPSVQSSGFNLLGHRGEGDGMAGIEGLGDSVIELQNLAAQPATVDVTLTQFETTRTLKRQLGARGINVLALKTESTVGLGGHTARIQSNTALGVLARTAWSTGAEAAYEAPEAARELILPLMARNVLSHTTSFFIQNTSGGDEPNKVKLNVFDDRDGMLLREIIVELDPYGVADYDPAFDPPRFGDLPATAAGSFVGSIRFTADQPVTVLAYGDELDLNSRGAAAYPGRPVAMASHSQYLPLVRANYLGDSWIGIASRESSPISVKLTYRGAADSPAGAGQTFEQSFEIGKRGAAFVDLGPRGRGTRPAPGLPRGTQVNRGFYGSVTIEATGRVLASVVQSTYANLNSITSTTSAAYNAFGPEDLGTRFGVAKLRYGAAASASKSQIVVMNPGGTAANVSITYNEQAQPVAGPSAAVPAGAMRVFAVDAKGADKPATISSDSPVAVLVNDTTITGAAGWGNPAHDSSIYWPARLGGGVTVTPTPTGGATTPRPPSATPTAGTPSPPPSNTPTRTASPETGTATQTSPTPSATPTDDGIGRKVYLPAGYRTWVLR
jgi:hypothetical protein